MFVTDRKYDGTLRERRARETRAALLSTGRRLLTENGYSGTSIEEIVASAGMTRGAFYKHFSDKEDFFEEVVRLLAEEVVAHIWGQVPETGRAVNGPPDYKDQLWSMALDPIEGGFPCEGVQGVDQIRTIGVFEPPCPGLPVAFAGKQPSRVLTRERDCVQIRAPSQRPAQQGGMQRDAAPKRWQWAKHGHASIAQRSPWRPQIRVGQRAFVLHVSGHVVKAITLVKET